MAIYTPCKIFFIHCFVLLFSELVSMLLNQKTTVYLVSGGFRSLIEPLAEYLGIPKKNIFANKLLFCDGMLSQCLHIFIAC